MITLHSAPLHTGLYAFTRFAGSDMYSHDTGGLDYAAQGYNDYA
jgi:hypothetical protein